MCSFQCYSFQHLLPVSSDFPCCVLRGNSRNVPLGPGGLQRVQPLCPAPAHPPPQPRIHFLRDSPSFFRLYLPQALLESLQNKRHRSVFVFTCRVCRLQERWLVPAVLGQVCSLACGRAWWHRPLPAATWVPPCKDVFHLRKVTRVAVGPVMRPALWGLGPHTVSSLASSEMTCVASLAPCGFLGPLCGLPS